MKIFKRLIISVFILGLFSGCSGKEPFTILFTSDDQGKLVPAG